MPEILQYVKGLDNEAKSIKRDAMKIAWYMRGMSYSEALNLTPEDREIVGDIIKDNLETTKKSGLPFF